MKNQIRFFTITVILAVLTISASGDAEPQLLSIVRDGTPQAVIVIPADGNKIKESAELLSEYIRKSAGADLTIVSEAHSLQDNYVRIHVGITEYVQGRKFGMDKLDADVFILDATDHCNIVIAGPTADGTEYGVLEFLERYVGVRWLFPGEMGEFVPRKNSIVIESINVRQEPAYLSRLVSPFMRDVKSDVYVWARHNRMNVGISFHHNLNTLFPPAKYVKSHPEYFPVINGQRHLPNTTVGWQPCFTADGTVQEATKTIVEVFDKHKDKMSFSLAANDNSGFCECNSCSALDGQVVNLLGFPSKSESYYFWCNKVVENVLQRHPDKYFGLLAYTDVMEPPRKTSVNPRIVPYITLDRMIWIDKDIETKGKLLNGKWEQEVETIGWYDYIYGCTHYLVPRIYFHHLADYLAYGYQHQVRHYYAEAYPSEDWLEGPKFYLLFKLLWNPNQNADELLKDWSVCCVGEKASVSLLAYFELWEKFWVERIPQTKWFLQNRHQTFLPFRGTQYLESVTDEDLQTAQSLLENCLRDADTEDGKRRAQFFLSAFMKRKEKVELLKSYLMLNKDPQDYQSELIIEQDGLDNYPNGWKPWQRPYSKAKTIYARDQGHHKAGSLMINAEASYKTPVVWIKDFPFEENKLYAMSVWYKNDNLPAEADLKITLKWKDGKKRWIMNRPAGDIPVQQKSADIVSGDTEWKNLKIIFKGPAGASFVCFMLGVENADRGRVYFDDFIFEELK